MTAPSSRPPAVARERVGRCSVSTISPAATEACMGWLARGEQPTISTSGATCFSTADTPPIRPPPPTAMYTRPSVGRCSSNSTPSEPWPAITTASL